MNTPRHPDTPRPPHPYPRGLYDPFPALDTGIGDISRGYDALAARIARAIPAGLRVLLVDGYNGVDWSAFRNGLAAALVDRHIHPAWTEMNERLLEPETIQERIRPFLGGDDPIFGTHFPFGLDTFFDPVKVARLRTDAAVARGRAGGGLMIVYGCGAGLIEQCDACWYADIPKDVIQIRARDGAVTNLGAQRVIDFSSFYKRSYFVDWPALNRQKRRLLRDIDLFLDLQDAAAPAAMDGRAFRESIRLVTETPFRVRPWFWPGPWGGQFMKGHMGLDGDRPNYAWSFELITPENGVVLERGGNRLECSFDCLHYLENERLQGPEVARQFGCEWPIRFDYLDTMEGGNLSVQCHPRPDYIRREFGETFTQDETYYIVDAKPGARVYLGLTEDCDPGEFRHTLERSAEDGVEVDVDRFVHSRPSRPHDLFMIPNGTVHCSGTDNLVLEISATPYIFTFKIYDYLRRDLEGNLRPINVDRAWENIRFERRSSWVDDSLVAKPRLLREGEGWKEFVLSDRKEFFYDIHRMEFTSGFEYELDGRALAVNLVDGEAVRVGTRLGRSADLRYLESMVIPAAAESIVVENLSGVPARMVLVFVRPGTGSEQPLNDPIQ